MRASALVLGATGCQSLGIGLQLGRVQKLQNSFGASRSTTASVSQVQSSVKGSFASPKTCIMSTATRTASIRKCVSRDSTTT
eukprot:2662115-Alexandrium_andersonii.AAC.1